MCDEEILASSYCTQLAISGHESGHHRKNCAGTAAPSCSPVRRPATRFSALVDKRNPGEMSSPGQPRAAVPTFASLTRCVFADANSRRDAPKQPSPKRVFACSPQRVDDTLKLRFSLHAIEWKQFGTPAAALVGNGARDPDGGARGGCPCVPARRR